MPGRALLPRSLIQRRDLLVLQCDPFSKGEQDFLPVLWTPGAGSLPVFLIAYGREGSRHALIPLVPSPPTLPGFLFMWAICSHTPLTKAKDDARQDHSTEFPEA